MNSDTNRITYSVIMPTLNSEGTIGKALESLKKQDFEQKRIEIIIADGGSTDNTTAIAQKFGARVITNDQVTPEYGKFLGLKEAKGQYAIFMDSDEVLIKKDALTQRLNLFKGHKNLKNIVTAGLVAPPDYPSASRFINSFGDPFSYFIYRLDSEDYFQSLRSKYDHKDTKVATVLRFKETDILPIIDGAHTFEIEYLKKLAGNIKPETIPIIFLLMGQKTKRLGVVKGDVMLHYSASNAGQLYKKIKSKVRGNIFEKGSANSGFQNRAKLNKKIQIRKLLFIPYALSVVLPITDALWLLIKKRNLVFLHYFLLTEYILSLIVIFTLMKTIGLKPKGIGYGQ